MDIDNIRQEAPGHLWPCRQKEEDRLSYDIAHKTRLYTYGAYAFAKYKDQPFNVLLRYEFVRSGTKADVLNVREVAQYVRVQLANMDLECNLIWSRHVGWKSDIEEVCILTHVSDDKIKQFVDLARGWRDGLDVHLVGYGEDFDFKGFGVNILDYMMRAASNETLCKNMSTLSERSDAMYGYRLWSSWNLKPDRRRKFSKEYDQNHS